MRVPVPSASHARHLGEPMLITDFSYGELGYVIIHQTLCDLFPPAGFHPDATLPLTPSDFITLVLLPEAAVRLIIEDLILPRATAIETLRESVEYGVAMFPADEGEGDLSHGGSLIEDRLGATEQMFMERARVRRRELEEEERREEEEARRAETATESNSKPRPRPRPKASGAQTDVESMGPSSSPPSGGSGSKRKTRGMSRGRSTKRNVGPDAGSVVIELSSDTAESDAAGPTKRRRKTRDAKSDVEMTDVGPSAMQDATPKAKVKPRPRPRARSTSRASSRQDDSDVQEVDPPPPSSSQAAPFPTRRMNTEVSMSIDSTPRAKSQAPQPGNTGSTPTAKHPLQIARERRQRESAR